MAFNVDQQQIDQMMAVMSQMAPGDLAELSEQIQEETNAIPDGHYVDYVDECIKESYEASKKRRDKDNILWKAHETELDSMADKEDWQSQIVLNKPFTTTIQAKSLVRRGLMERPEYFNLDPTDKENPLYLAKTKFWEKALKYWTGTREAYVPHVFADAAEMGFAVGQSMSIKILWKPDQNGVFRLYLVPVEPWKTYPDPDRQPRMSWSGLYNIHEEWVDYYQLKEMELLGHYQNIDQVKMGRSSKSGDGYGYEDKEEERKKKGQEHARNRYRKAVLIREFWGTILDENGDVLMPNASYTVCNGVIIRPPRPNPFSRLKWPWVDFSPIPHLLNFHGYGIYETVLSVWQFQNALMNLYIDNENWRINNMYEMAPDKLEDPSDDEIYPGKIIRKKAGVDGPALTPVSKAQSNLQDVQFMWSMATNLWENGSFITELLKGEQGERKKITATEIQLKLQQSIGVFDSIGKDVERGGTELMWGIKEVLTTFWDDLDRVGMKDIFGQDPFYQQLMMSGMLSPQARMETMNLDCEVKISGVSKLFDRANIIEKLKSLAMFSASPQYGPYAKHAKIIRRFAEELNQSDLVKSEEEIQKENMMKSRQAGVQNAIAKAMQAAGGGAPVQGAVEQPIQGGPNANQAT